VFRTAVNRNNLVLTVSSEKLDWEQFVPYCVEREIRLGTFVPQSLRKEQEGKSELLKVELLFLKG